jgi:hypothetical protein
MVGIKPLEPSPGFLGSPLFKMGLGALTGGAALGMTGIGGAAAGAGVGLAAAKNPRIGQVLDIGRAIAGGSDSPKSESSAPSSAIGRRLSLFNPGQAPTYDDPSAELYRSLGRRP